MESLGCRAGPNPCDDVPTTLVSRRDSVWLASPLICLFANTNMTKARPMMDDVVKPYAVVETRLADLPDEMIGIVGQRSMELEMEGLMGVV